ncbi:unnamed protein product, partial [Iphiclides podalirius]
MILASLAPGVSSAQLPAVIVTNEGAGRVLSPRAGYVTRGASPPRLTFFCAPLNYSIERGHSDRGRPSVSPPPPSTPQPPSS